MLAVDCSNYTSPMSLATLEAWKREGVGLVIIQCFPPSYTAKYANQLHQMRLCAQAGMPFDVYAYDYLGSPDWLFGALDGITRANGSEGLKPRQVWLDEEDVESEQGWTPAQRVAAIRRSVAALKAWPLGDGVGRIYTAAWWWIPKTDNSTEFADCELWDADYDGIASAELSWTPYGGWSERRIKQFRGTSSLAGVGGIDLNVLSVDEAAELEPAPEPTEEPMPEIDQGWLNKKDDVVRIAGFLHGEFLEKLLAEANRKGGPRKTSIKALASTLERETGRVLA